MSSASKNTSSDARRIIVAIDFGTTCSSIGYVHTAEPEGRKVIKTWPDTYQSTEWVPTTIKYDDDDPSSYKWGYQLDEEDVKHEWFKLGLYPELGESELPRKYPSHTALPAVSGAKSEKLVTDYLRGLRQHAETHVAEKLGEGVLRNRRPEYIITVPAVWSEKAQATTRDCAENAGMGNRDKIQIITEPEAAGIYALKNMKLDLNVEETFVLCDAGGGTVDLTSYTVAEVGKTPLIFESALPSGSLCGSTFLNRIFDHHLRQKFAGCHEWDEDYHREAMHRFEIKIKREFTGDLKKSFNVPARGLKPNKSLGIRNGQVEISGKELASIFEPVIKEILLLVTAQIKATERSVTAVLLAGGFGSSNYLMSRIKEKVGNIRVVQIENGDTAIVRGALIRGIAKRSPQLANVRVGARKARKHYGTLAYEAFDPKIHDKSKREDDDFTGGHRIQVMNWFVLKGSAVKESKPNSFPFYFDKKVNEGRPSIIEMTLYACEDAQNGGAPMYKDEKVKKLIELKADVTSISVNKFNREPGEYGEMYYKLDFDIEMICRSGSFNFAIVYDGKKYNTVKQEFV